MLSGIGPRDHLAQFGIPVVADLFGVGENLQDHIIVQFDYRVKNVSEITISGNRFHNLNVQNLYNFLTNASGPLTMGDVITSTYVASDINGDRRWPDGMMFLAILQYRKYKTLKNIFF